jgi:tetratricopeptide (TPR) repeat protein
MSSLRSAPSVRGAEYSAEIALNKFMKNQEKQTIDWQYFFKLAKEAFEAKELDVARAYAAAALQMPRESEADFYDIYYMLYQIFDEQLDYKRAKDYITLCMGIQPSNKDLAYDWYTKYESIFFSFGEQVPADFIADIVHCSTVGGGVKAIEAAKPDWIICNQNGHLSNHKDLYYAIKLATDNSKSFVKINEDSYAVMVRFAEKLKVQPTDFMIADQAKDYQQYIQVQ